MQKPFPFKPEQGGNLLFLLKWLLYLIPVAFITGSVVAFFLWSLDQVTLLRFQYPWLLLFLPIAGLVIFFVYKNWGKNSDQGNNLILDQIHSLEGEVPKRMVPLVLGGTLITHLFGGSAGREGTAVQMGGSIASAFGRIFSLTKEELSIMLTAGISAGFAAVFGTPIAGAVFGVEVLAIGKMHYKALLPCLIAAILGHLSCSFWGIGHSHYHIDFHSTENISTYLPLDLLLAGKVLLASLCFGLAAYLFASLSHGIKKSASLLPKPWLAPFLGGIVIILLSFIPGNTNYLGLGVLAENPGSITLSSAFTAGGADTFSWLWKLLFTAITVGTGFKGGEVTPLFYIGATLGNTLALWMGAPVDLFAAIGFIAVFAGATNTPIACMIMGIELFGGEHIFYFAIACMMAYFFSGHSGIYSSQKINQKW